jgi:PAS domain S-box-containing protein
VCKEIYGYEPEELLGLCFFDVLPTEERKDAFRKTFLDCVAKGIAYKSIEIQCRRKDGEQIYIESSGTPVFDEGRVIGFRGIDRDITARKRVEEERRLLEEQSRQSQKLEALGTLAGGISHDMNNILTPILGYCSLCKNDLGKKHPLYKDLEDIENCTHRAAALIRRIMSFCRKQDLVILPLDLNELVHDMSKMLKRLIREDIRIEFELSDDLWLIDADCSQIEQILVNLVVNARDAMDEPGELFIRTETRIVPPDTLYDVEHREVSGEYVVLTVSDRGSGIDKHTLNLIFDPFFTTKEIGKGTGLGLATVHGIVARHNAHIIVESQQGLGSSFHIFFPKSDGKIKPEELKNGKEIYLEQGTETILLAEDDKEVLQMLSQTLSRSGYKVLTAPDGKIALEMFERMGEEIDLLITDLIMPGMGGKALGISVRRQAKKLPIIYMTGHSFDIDLEEIKNMPRAVLLQKPFAVENFSHMVRKLLDGE